MKKEKLGIKLHHDDLPDNIIIGDEVAIDTETLGLNIERDRLCLVQINFGVTETHLIKIKSNVAPAPNLKKILEDKRIKKIFHFARFDVAVLNRYLSTRVENIYCTKIASKIARTYTDKHSLKELCKELLNAELSKEQQSSDWGANTLSEKQMIYAANDVIFLHKIKECLDEILNRENKYDLAQSCFNFIETQVRLDLNGWKDQNIFEH